MASPKRTDLPTTRRPFGFLSARDPFARFRQEMDEVFSHYFAPRGEGNGESAFGMPTSLDLSETDKTVTITLDVPGVEEKDLDITLSDGGVLISGKREHEKEEEGENFHRVERAYGAFQRLVPLPCEVNPDKIEARLTKGVLKITLPKSERAKETSRKIAIKSN